jgi:serine/threonine protein phosphatase PrpC
VATVLREAFDGASQMSTGWPTPVTPTVTERALARGLALDLEPAAYLAHVGDSRAYLFRNGRLRRLAKGQTRGQQMVDAEILTPEQGMLRLRSHAGLPH